MEFNIDSRQRSIFVATCIATKTGFKNCHFENKANINSAATPH